MNNLCTYQYTTFVLSDGRIYWAVVELIKNENPHIMFVHREWEPCYEFLEAFLED